VFWTKVVEKIETKSSGENQNNHFVFCNFSMKILPFMGQYGKIWQSHIAQSCQYNVVHALYMLDNHGYNFKFRICNTYCFSTTRLVTQTCFSILLYVLCLSCCFLLVMNCLC